ncbi:MAG: hypothetical protein U9R56_03585, partial [candidate division Zixibacteria bacterium]|nr:hypothetical protein [candidate division Zixibacteria bacterium]
MRKLTLFITIAFLICTGNTVAENGIEGAISIYQTDSSKTGDVLLFSDTVQFIKGLTASGFLIAFSIDIDVTEIDSVRTWFTVHLVTLGPPANTYSRNFTVEYGLPARITNIKGKNEANYTLVISPLAKIDIDTSFCPYDHLAEGTFEYTPSANMDIYYMPNSLGDFFWSVARGLLEERYRQFQSLFNFSLPGKYSVYLCPCFLPSVIWDRRFGIATNPTRGTAHAIYTQALNAADPFVVIHTAVLRNYGYSPLFLSEGLANYLSFAIFDMKEILQQGRTPRIADLLHTYSYLTADAYLADRTSASFVTFLIDKYGFPRFRRLYKAADDLNLTVEIEETYNTSIGELEENWREYVDTVTVSLDRLFKFVNIAEA